MMTDQLDKAEAHITTAIRRLEMMQWFLRNKKLAAHKHVPLYFNSVRNDLIAIQNALLSDDEYTENVAQGLARINKKREYQYDVTADKEGKLYYSVNAILPLDEMKKNVLWAVP
jgi:hypothetical protein